MLYRCGKGTAVVDFAEAWGLYRAVSDAADQAEMQIGGEF
jgi:hypothetical protein